jgi:hypothetical protein
LEQPNLAVSKKGNNTMKEPDTPQGTLALLLVYALIVIALWGSAYLTMLSRGTTQ